MMKKKIKQGGALVLAAVLTFSAFALDKAFAAIAIDTNATCSVQINVPEEKFTELDDLDIPVNLYKVASVDATGKYTAVEAFDSMKADLAGVNSKTSADEWLTFAAEAKEIVDAEDSKAAVTDTGIIKDGTALIDELAVGLYLVDAQTVYSDYYQYDFAPYLISLPNNYYEEGVYENDTWVYDLTGDKAIGLKPERSDRYGKLIIEKDLKSYNESLGEATFVFQVEAVKYDVDYPNAVPAKVYSDVISITFDHAGMQHVLLEGIPAGAVVTVEEVYSSESYSFLSSDILETAEDGKLVVIADPVDDKDGDIAAIRFTNEYNGGMNGGSGLVNSFSYDAETKEWSAKTTIDSQEGSEEINTKPQA